MYGYPPWGPPMPPPPPNYYPVGYPIPVGQDRKSTADELEKLAKILRKQDKKDMKDKKPEEKKEEKKKFDHLRWFNTVALMVMFAVPLCLLEIGVILGAIQAFKILLK